MFGFLLVVYVILLITCSETTILLCYFHLCAEVCTIITFLSLKVLILGICVLSCNGRYSCAKESTYNLYTQETLTEMEREGGSQASASLCEGNASNKLLFFSRIRITTGGGVLS